LVEAFPAAQLRHWSLPHTGYAEDEGRAVWRRIVDGLTGRLNMTAEQQELGLQSPDALDAMIAAFVAIAVLRRAALDEPAQRTEEGWIADAR
jgi:hypothetical protein